MSLRRRSLLVLPIVMAMTLGSAPAKAEPVAPTKDSVIETHFYSLQERLYTLSAGVPWVTSLRGSTVLALGSDAGFEISPLIGGTTLTYPVLSFDAATGTEQKLGSLDFTAAVGAGSRMRILDFQFTPEIQTKTKSEAHVLVSFAAFNASTGCRRTYLQEAVIDLTGNGGNHLGKRWFTLPCIRPVNPPDGALVDPVLHQSGGRIAVVPASERTSPKKLELYFSTGDFQILTNQAGKLPAATRRLLSSILKVSQDGSATVVASGMRNPQGLTNARLDGRISLIATTHGPRGGDELIRVQQGANYGWPTQSYGTVYSYKPTPVQSKPKVEGALPTAALPAFSWVPSIGPSAVIQIRGRAFSTWWAASRSRPDSDLLVSGMGATSLFRIRWQDGAVRYVEAIPVGLRVRSLAQTSTGAIVGGTDSGELLLLTPALTWSTSNSAFQ